MARLITSGFELASVGGEIENFGVKGTGGTTGITFPAGRRSDACLQLVPNATGDHNVGHQKTLVVGRRFRARVYVRLDPGGNIHAGVPPTSESLFYVALSSLAPPERAGIGLYKGSFADTYQFCMYDQNGVLAGSLSSALTLGQWYRLELSWTQTGSSNNAQMGYRVDGTDIVSETTTVLFGNATSVDQFIFAQENSSSGATGYVQFDDFALNDDQGTDQNSWPGDGTVWLLRPKADSARGTNWLAGAGGTASLFDAVDNAPPVGVVLASATNTSQIKNAAKDTTGTYDTNVESYDEAGIPSSDTIKLCGVHACAGQSSTTLVTYGLTGVSNPAITENTAPSPPLVAAGTHPTNWIGASGVVWVYNPTVTRSTRPVIRVRKGTSTTTALMLDAMALIVETVPGATPSARPLEVVGQAVQRAALWMRGLLRKGVPWLSTPAIPQRYSSLTGAAGCSSEPASARVAASVASPTPASVGTRASPRANSRHRIESRATARCSAGTPMGPRRASATAGTRSTSAAASATRRSSRTSSRRRAARTGSLR